MAKQHWITKIASALEPKEDTLGPYLSTGCTLLNLAISDDPFGGFLAGKYYIIVGDSTSGKTFFSMTCFAEATRNDDFKDADLIYDNIEDGRLMNVTRFFGQRVADRMRAPSTGSDGEPVYSRTIEEFYYHLDDALAKGKRFIYVLDSMDGLDCEDDIKKFDEQKKAHRGGKKAKGSYGMAKAKANSMGLRKALAGLRDTGSILIIITQTRDNPNASMFQSNKTRSGGKALRFYATVEIWTALGGKIKKTIKKKTRKIGDKILITLKKNRVTGKLHQIQTAIYPSYGVDDIGSNIDYLVEEDWWKKRKNTIDAAEFNLEDNREKLIRAIEKSPKKVRKLAKVVGKCWRAIEKSCELNRKARY